MASREGFVGEEHTILTSHGLRCLHCGDSYTLDLPMPMWAMSALVKGFAKEHRRCPLDPERGLVCAYCALFGHKESDCPRLAIDGDPHAWLRGPDTGASSRTIWHQLMGRPGPGASTPHDPADFGRCYRLLRAIPGWRERIGEMATVPGWAPLVAAWDELEALYEQELPTGQAPKLFARMQQLLEEAP